MAAADELRRFDAMLACVASQMPDAETRDAISSSFAKHWERPPMENLEKVLRRKLSLEGVRRVCFLPEPADLESYVLAFAPRPPGCPLTHPLCKVQPLFLGTLYMTHRQDEILMRSFIVMWGGLRALVGLLADENLYVALDTLFSLTSLFDFHGDAPGDATLRRAMANLAELDVAFIKTLVAGCYDNRFPGCSDRALRILAFWLSLVRYFFCKDKIMRLGRDVLDVLERWSKREDGEPEERELAKTLYADFSRFPLDE
ncbi:hypothetical protein T492DRAFT_877180 [Pavlovales sp. CCMP2436]|nr:hypothetical protein T492DRAFT_877180 [Pavlovales sp. CCMP2436]